jgi:hypothetical protein
MLVHSDTSELQLGDVQFVSRHSTEYLVYCAFFSPSRQLSVSYVAHPESKNRFGLKSVYRTFKNYLYFHMLVPTLNYFST